jgi:dihydropteroate synthase
MVRDGVDLLDLGGESTRPGAAPVSIQEETDRVAHVVDALARRLDVPLSIDTRKARVAAACIEAGALMVNDVSGFADPEMGELVARTGVAWVLMHMPNAVGEMGWSQRAGPMPEGLHAGLQRVADDLDAIVVRACNAGVAREQLAVDPGIGFGKTLAQNLAFLRHTGPVARLDLPVFIGPSRKSFIGAISDAEVSERLMGTAAAVAAAVLGGASFVRVHDVAEMRQVVDVAQAIRASEQGPDQP